MTSEPTLTRRRFLVLGAAVGVAAAGGGCGLLRQDSSENRWNVVFGDAMPGILVVGRGAVEQGIVPDRDAARAALPADERVIDGGAGDERLAEVVNDGGFAGSFHELVDEQLQAEELVTIEGYLVAPAEAALAALVYLDD